MKYYTKRKKELTEIEVKTLPKEVEELYQRIRTKYVIEYFRSDWADDDRDAGMGYCYDNSYEIFREPQRNELVLDSDGELCGFCVKEGIGSDDFFLKLENGAKIYESNTSSSFYGDSESWTLRIEENPAPFEYVFIPRIKETNSKKIFKASDFDKKLVEYVYNWNGYEDNRGRFNNAYRVILKLSKKGIKDPDLVLEKLSDFKPVIIKL